MGGASLDLHMDTKRRRLANAMADAATGKGVLPTRLSNLSASAVRRATFENSHKQQEVMASLAAAPSARASLLSPASYASSNNTTPPPPANGGGGGGYAPSLAHHQAAAAAAAAAARHSFLSHRALPAYRGIPNFPLLPGLERASAAAAATYPPLGLATTAAKGAPTTTTTRQQHQQQQQPTVSSSSLSSSKPAVVVTYEEADAQGFISHPGIHDVLSGRGKSMHEHPGNIQFRKFVDAHKAEYKSKSRARKSGMAQDLLAKWKYGQDPPGRFLERSNDSSNGWTILPDDRALQKLTHRLREGNKGSKIKAALESVAAASSARPIPEEPSVASTDHEDEEEEDPERGLAESLLSLRKEPPSPPSRGQREDDDDGVSMDVAPVKKITKVEDPDVEEARNEKQATTTKARSPSFADASEIGGDLTKPIDEEKFIYDDGSSMYPGSIKPRIHDVLCGRGNGVNKHIGNIKFRRLLEANQHKYKEASTTNKPVVASNLVWHWKQMNPPGRFLTKCSDNLKWVEMSDVQATLKVSKRLRDGLIQARKDKDDTGKKSRRRNSESKKTKKAAAAAAVVPKKEEVVVEAAAPPPPSSSLTRTEERESAAAHWIATKRQALLQTLMATSEYSPDRHFILQELESLDRYTAAVLDLENTTTAAVAAAADKVPTKAPVLDAVAAVAVQEEASAQAQANQLLTLVQVNNNSQGKQAGKNLKAPTENDVVFCEENPASVRNHLGNIRFGAVASRYIAQYHAADASADSKYRTALEIALVWEAQVPMGRFLVPHPTKEFERLDLKDTVQMIQDMLSFPSLAEGATSPSNKKETSLELSNDSGDEDEEDSHSDSGSSHEEEEEGRRVSLDALPLETVDAVRKAVGEKRSMSNDNSRGPLKKRRKSTKQVLHASLDAASALGEVSE